MHLRSRISQFSVALLLAVGTYLPVASALDLDWSGQFRTETNWIYNYPQGNGSTLATTDSRFTNAPGGGTRGSYVIPGGGSRDAFFQSFFLRLRPSVIVNDNVFIKSEWWVGDPIYSFYGSGAPGATDQRYYYSTSSRGSGIVAQRVWGEFLTDLGTIQAGRIPLNWGLGVVWNSGNHVYDRHMSTGDGVRMLAKFGSFTLSPGLVKYNMGNNIGGACPSATGCTTGSATQGGASVSDLSVALKYENPDESVEMGVNFIRRLAGGSQGNGSGFYGVEGGPSGLNYNTWDIYGKKSFGNLSFGIEAPITNGTVGDAKYKTFAVAIESDLKLNETWNLNLKMGHAPGQPDLVGTTRPGQYKAFYFHPAYKLGLIMFNYQLANFAGPNSQNDPSVTTGNLKSPYDNPIVNANYLAFGGGLKADKWNFHGMWIYAKANEKAGNNTKFFNYWTRQFHNRDTTTAEQSDSLGWEMDYGATFHWDDAFRFDMDFGWYFPGDFYKFSNASVSNSTSPVFATVFRVGVNF